MNDDREHSPWMCHICSHTSNSTEPVACSICYKITCAVHLVHKTTLNRDSGLYELQPVCLECQVRNDL